MKFEIFAPASAVITALLLRSNSINGFVIQQAPLQHRSASSSSELKAVELDATMIGEMTAARAAFALCFFGSVGSAAVGRSVIPVTIDQYKSTQALMGDSNSLGGEDMGLFGYPEPVYSNDVLSIINNEEYAIYDIIREFPISGALPGYLRYESMLQANPNVPRMAVRAVFDAIALGINKKAVDPRTAEAKFGEYVTDLDGMRKDLRVAKGVGILALFLLLGTIGTVDYFAVYHLFHGWFPQWEGFSQFPSSLFDDRGISNLGNCFVGDVPEMPAKLPSDSFPM